jgi:hypothetical protein
MGSELDCAGAAGGQGGTIPAASRSWVPMTSSSLRTSEWQLRHEDALPPYRPNAGYLIRKETAALAAAMGEVRRKQAFLDRYEAGGIRPRADLRAGTKG